MNLLICRRLQLVEEDPEGPTNFQVRNAGWELSREKKRGFFAKNLKRLNEKQIAAIIEFDLWGRSLYEWSKMFKKSLLFLDER